MTYLVVGESPGRDGTRKLDVTLACKTVQRRPVAGTLGWLRAEHRRLFNFVAQATHVNLLDRWPGEGHGKGSDFPMAKARECAGLFVHGVRNHVSVTPDGDPYYRLGRRTFPRPNLILLAGRRVAKAFRIYSFDYFVTVLEHPKVGWLPTVVVPHPSGLNQWWNDDVNRTVGRMFLEGLGEVDVR